MKKLIFLSCIVLMLVGCADDSIGYNYWNDPSKCGKVVKQYFANKSKLDLNHVVEYDKGSESYSIRIFSNNLKSDFTDVSMYKVNKEFVEKYFPEDLVKDK